MGAGLLAWRTGDVAGADAEFQAAMTAVEPEAASVPLNAVAATATRFLVLGSARAAATATAPPPHWPATRASWIGDPQLAGDIGLGEPRAYLALARDDAETAYRRRRRSASA